MKATLDCQIPMVRNGDSDGRAFKLHGDEGGMDQL